MQTFKQFSITEAAGLSRIVEHMRTKPFAIISAFRNEYEESENKRRARKLERRISTLGYGFIRMQGAWVEDGDKEVVEDSIFIIGEGMEDSMNVFAEDMSAVGNFFQQEAIVFGDTKHVWLIYEDGKREKIGVADKVKTTDVGQYYSKIGGKKFAFTENADYMEGHFENFADFKKKLKKSYRIKRIGEGEFSDVYLVRPKSMAGLLVGFKKDFVLKITKEFTDHSDVDDQSKFVKIVRDDRGRNMLYPVITHFMTLESKSGKDIDITVMEYLEVNKNDARTKNAARILQRYAMLIDDLGYEEPDEDDEDYDEYEDLVDDLEHDYNVSRDDLLDFHTNLYHDNDLEYDVAPQNIGFRKDGSLVIFDPVA